MNCHHTCHPWIIALVFTTFYVSYSQGYYYKRVCYFTNWSKYRHGQAKFTADKINPFLCTHLVFAFGDFGPDGNLKKLEEWHDTKDYETFRRLKEINPELRTLLALGGWNFGSVRFSDMAKNPAIRKTFVSSTVRFLKANGFDGLDIDWEYPGDRGGLAADKQNLVTLCKELKDAFITESQRTGREPFLLTAAVPASRYKINLGYDVPSLNNYLDFINVMTYDFHGGWEDKVGQNSPLFPSPIEEGDNLLLNIRETVNYWHTSGMPKDKIVVGLASYGRSFRLTTSSYGLGAPASKGPQGPFTREAGFWAYYEVCMEIDSDYNGANHGTVYYDTDQEVPFYVKDDLWVGYDNERSIKAKTRWLKQNGYGGIMLWSLALDDFNQMCPYTTRPYPLLHTAVEELGVPINTPPPTTAKPRPASSGVVTNPRPRQNTQPRVQTVIAPSVPDTPSFQGQVTRCPQSGHHMFPDPKDCHRYIECHMGHQHSRQCPAGLHWDTQTNSCNWPHKVGCVAG